MRRVDELLDQYSMDHQNPTNQMIHVFCVPAIVWSVAAMLWCIPVPNKYLEPGFWGALTMFAAWAYYWRMSKSLSIGLLLSFTAAGFLNRWILYTYGIYVLFGLAVGVFVIAWIVQFIGHKIEGKRPSFLTDMVYLLVGPMWTLRKLYYRLGIKA
ncbi:MAG: Mpo1-like protein [Arenimonas sp.]